MNTRDLEQRSGRAYRVKDGRMPVSIVFYAQGVRSDRKPCERDDAADKDVKEPPR